MLDEARRTKHEGIRAATEDYFRGMDRGADLGLEEIQGRNTWILWSAGNDRFWDWLARQSAGSFDLLKIKVGLTPTAREDYARRTRRQRANTVRMQCLPLPPRQPDGHSWGGE